MDVWKNGGVDVLCLHTSTLPHIHTRIPQADSVLATVLRSILFFSIQRVDSISFIP
ncbi:hypothetical protein GGP85_002959 [Salinibacter ruber]|nr:hypothetical protein [Salinibacter ruber]